MIKPGGRVPSFHKVLFSFCNINSKQFIKMFNTSLTYNKRELLFNTGNKLIKKLDTHTYYFPQGVIVIVQ